MTTQDWHEILGGPVAKQAADIGFESGASVILVHVTKTGPLFVTSDRKEAAALLGSAGMRMPPEGGVVVIFVGDGRPIASCRALRAPMSKGGQA